MSTVLKPKCVLFEFMKTSDFDFDLPAELIAQHPKANKSDNALLVFKQQKIADQTIKQLIDYLQEGDVLVFNNAKVIKAKLLAKNLTNNALISLNLDQQENDIWLALCKPAKKVKIDDILEISNKDNDKFLVKVIDKNNFGSIKLKFNIEGEEFFKMLDKYGEIPLPPYIKRQEDLAQKNDDLQNYQTCYASKGYAVACPTAGLHFTEDLLHKIASKGIAQAFVTLNVGAGTFLPVKSELINDHNMHQESFEIDETACNIINNAKKNQRRIIAVGTTSLRVLETVADDNGFLKPCKASTKIFITPSYQFKITNALLTNFHLPKSTLFMLVSAFVGIENAHKIYQHAIDKKYRFYSYGDACLLIP